MGSAGEQPHFLIPHNSPKNIPNAKDYQSSDKSKKTAKCANERVWYKCHQCWGPEGEKAIDPPRNAYKPPEKETKRPTSIPASTPEIK